MTIAHYTVTEVREVVCFDRHMYSYQVTVRNDLPLKLIQPADLYDVHPFSIQTVVSIHVSDFFDVH